MNISEHSYRFADAVLRHRTFAKERDDIMGILANAPVPLLDPRRDPGKGGVKRRRRDPLRGDPGARYFFLPVDQVALNDYLDGEFGRRGRGWEHHPLVVSDQEGRGPVTGLRADYKRNRVQVEAQFGNMARWYTDVFKFQLAYAQDQIDIGVLIVPTQRFANLIDENVAHYERVCRELPWAKMSLTLPILVLGIEPDDDGFATIRETYEAAASAFTRSRQQAGETIVAIPFREREAESEEKEEPSEPD